MSASDYQEIIDLRRSVKSAWENEERFDAMILPTTPITARPIDSLASDEDFFYCQWPLSTQYIGGQYPQ